MTTWLKVLMEGGAREGEGEGARSDEAREEGSVRQSGNGSEGVTSLCIKLEKFIIYHYTHAEMPPNRASPPLTPTTTSHRGRRRERGRKKEKLSEPQQQPMGKINMQIYSRN